MGRIHPTIDDSVESQVRTHIRMKGDLGRIVNEALEAWLARQLNEALEAWLARQQK